LVIFDFWCLLIYFVSFMYTDYNNFNGTIPPALFQLKNLKEIILGKIVQLHIRYIAWIGFNLILCKCLDDNRLTGPIPDFPRGSNLEVISAGRLFVGFIFFVQHDVDSWNALLVNVGSNGYREDENEWISFSSTIPLSISNLRHTRVFNFGKLIKHC